MPIGLRTLATVLAPIERSCPFTLLHICSIGLKSVECGGRYRSVGLDVFGMGEHHRVEFLDSAPSVILAAAAVRTTSIRLTSAVTVLNAVDPVRYFQQFATLDLISKGRAEIVVGRGSFGGVSRITFQRSSASLATAAMKRSIELLGARAAPIVRAAEQRLADDAPAK